MSNLINIEELIGVFEKLNQKFEIGSELSEQGEGGTTGGKSPTKRFDISSPSRGPANQLGNTKWSDSYQIKRGVANTLF
jgi:hypothetical protein